MNIKNAYPIFLFLLVSCGNVSKKQSEPVVNDSKQAIEAERPIVSKELSVPSSFDHIINLGSIDIVYTQGEKSIRIEGDSVFAEKVKTEFDSNLLTLSIENESNQQTNAYGTKKGLVAYISTPSLTCVSICSSGDFTYEGEWTNDTNVQIGMYGDGNIILGSVTTPSFILESNYGGSCTIGHLKSSQAVVNSRGEASITADLDVNNLSLYNQSAKLIKLTGTVMEKSILKPSAKTLEDLTN